MKKLFIFISLLLVYLFTKAQTNTNITPYDAVGIGTSTPGAKIESRSDANELKRLLVLRNQFRTSGLTGSRLGFGTYRDIDAHNLGAAIDAVHLTGIYNGDLAPGASLNFSTSHDGASGLIKRMTILNTGNVGIGLDIPQTSLQVKGSANFMGTTSLGTTTIGGAGDYGMFYLDRTNVWSEVAIHNKGSGVMLYANPQNAQYTGMWETKFSPLSAGLISNPYYPLVLGAGGEAMRIKPGGNVGIGMANPLGKLSVYGGSLNNVNLLSFQEVDGGKTFYFEGNFAGLGVTGNWLTLKDWSGHDAMAWRGDGNVGVGTTNPVNSKIHVRESPEGEFALKMSNRNNSQTWGMAIDAMAVDDKSFALIDLNKNVNRFTINSDGNVGIGTTSPGTMKLAVEGTIGARKVQVTLSNSWPDYVFHPSYKLRPLSSLENYINENRHLPDVPSAKELEKEGLDLGGNQAVLLKKIEELTLYVIEQGKENKLLRQRLEKMEKKVN